MSEELQERRIWAIRDTRRRSSIARTRIASAANHYYAGIVADVGIKADNTFAITDCTNETEFTEGEGAGIVHHLTMQKGTMERFRQRESRRSLRPGRMRRNPAMWRIWQMTGNCRSKTARLTVDGTAKDHVGGIVCFTAYYKSQEGNANTSFAIRGCKNSGTPFAASTNGYIGGILGVDGFMRTPTEVSDCENSGDISFTKILRYKRIQPEMTENENGVSRRMRACRTFVCDVAWNRQELGRSRAACPWTDQANSGGDQ